MEIWRNHIRYRQEGARKMIQCLRVSAALIEDLDLVPYTIYKFSCRGANAFSMVTTHAHSVLYSCRQNMHTHHKKRKKWSREIKWILKKKKQAGIELMGL